LSAPLAIPLVNFYFSFVTTHAVPCRLFSSQQQQQHMAHHEIMAQQVGSAYYVAPEGEKEAFYCPTFPAEKMQDRKTIKIKQGNSFHHHLVASMNNTCIITI
jgi:hypothetical protein